MSSKLEHANTAIVDVAGRIVALAEIGGYSPEQMAESLGISQDVYDAYISGSVDLPFSFIHNCARMFGVELSDILEGWSAHLTSYAVTRRGEGRVTSQEESIEVRDLAPRFRDKNAEPYWVTYKYSDRQQDSPIPLISHSGQEFNVVFSGQLKVQIGEHVEVLSEGDSIFYNSKTPHGMIAVGGSDCVFCAIVMPDASGKVIADPLAAHRADAATYIVDGTSDKAGSDALTQVTPRVWQNFCEPQEDDKGVLSSISFKNIDKFNFAFDVVDAIAEKTPNKRALQHVDRDGQSRLFTFEDISKQSARAANYFTSLGILRGDRVLLVLKRNWQFWPIMTALHKIGAVAVPATDQLLQKDYEYRFIAAGISAIVCTGQSETSKEVDKALAAIAAGTAEGVDGANAMDELPDGDGRGFNAQETVKIMVNGERDGWRSYDDEIERFRSVYPRSADAPCADDLLLMYFTSGTTGYPKIAAHKHTYPLGHFITAKYWHNVKPDGLHFTISDTGWAKAMWGMLYGQWLCEAGIFVYDFDRFDAFEILPMFKKYGITTFCAPPTMYRFLIREDISKFDLSTISYLTTAGEALNAEVFNLFKKATGLSIMEGFGQTESTLMIGTLRGMKPKMGSMGKPSPLYNIMLMDNEGNETPRGEVGEIVVITGSGDSENIPCGLFVGYYRDSDQTKSAWYDGAYHTGDTAWMDEDGYLHFVGRVDDLIKSSGYRIGPFEVESVIMELPYVLECAVSPEPDEIRGQVVKASIVLTKDKAPSEELKKEIQEYVKSHTAPFKYPRIVVFRDSLPKTISGKIKRNQL